MKSKSFDLKASPVAKSKHNKTFDFVGLYKSAAETNVITSETSTSGESSSKDNKSRHLHSKKKNKNVPVDLSSVTIDGSALAPAEARSSTVNDARITSTPNAGAKGKVQTPKVKSIMKNSSVVEDSAEEHMDYTPNYKPKKRNKSVSFMLEENEEIAIKRTKSEETVKVDKKSEKLKAKLDKKKLKKIKKKEQEEKENAVTNMDIDKNVIQNMEGQNKKLKKKHKKPSVSNPDAAPEESAAVDKKERKAKLKELKKRKKEESSDPAETENTNNEEETHRPKVKKIKKKRQAKAPAETGTNGETETKATKKEPRPDLIAGDLENLSIGDNAHTLTNLLDVMTVIDKNKKKKNKQKHKKNKKPASASVSSSENADLEKIEEGKEKIKWKKRFNKDKKGDMEESNIATTVIVESLPLKMITSYKKVLADHFGPCGLIKKVGIAEVYPANEPKPVFTTTINFFSEDASEKALEEDNTQLEGTRIRVKRPLPATQTTLVVRSYADLSEQALSSAFSIAGKIRKIRHPIKGKKAMTTAFVEFDGPEAVEKALKKAEDAKIGGKKIHVAKFENRGSKRSHRSKSNAESENEADSEESND